MTGSISGLRNSRQPSAFGRQVELGRGSAPSPREHFPEHRLITTPSGTPFERSGSVSALRLRRRRRWTQELACLLSVEPLVWERAERALARAPQLARLPMDRRAKLTDRKSTRLNSSHL